MKYLKSCVLMVLIAFLLVACGGGGGTSTTTTQPTSAVTPLAVTPVPQKPGTTKVTFWFGLSGSNGNVVQSLINRYNQSQDKYYVVGVFQASYDDTLSKFNASLAGKDLPNVVQIYDIGTQRMIDTKKIVPVQDLVNRDHMQDVIDDLEPAIRSYYTIDGKLYSMPFNSSTAVMYYDKNAFKEVGLDVNKKAWTYDELLDAAKKLTKKDSSGKISRAGVGLYGYAWLFEQELAIHNALHAEPGNGRGQRATKYVFNNDAGVKWLELQKQLMNDGSATYFGAAGDNAAATAFMNGKIAIHFASIASLRGYIDTTKKNGGKVDIGVAYMPRQVGAQGRNIIGGASLWVTNTGTQEQQAGAWDFVKFSIQKDIQAYWSANTGYVPVRLSTYDLPEMKETLNKYPQFQAAIDQIRAAPTSVYNAGCVAGNLLTVRTNISQAIDNYLSGKASTAQAALDAAVQKSNESLEEYNAAL